MKRSDAAINIYVATLIAARTKGDPWDIARRAALDPPATTDAEREAATDVLAQMDRRTRQRR